MGQDPTEPTQSMWPVESKSAVFISVLRVSPVDYLIYFSYAAGSNPVTDHQKGAFG